MKVKMLDAIRTFSKNIHILTFSEGILALALGVFYFLQILYYNEINISPKDIGIIYSVGSLLSLIGFFMGPFIGKIGRKNLMCIGILIIAIGVVMHILFTTFILLLIGQALMSIGTSFIQVTDIQLLYSYTVGSKECCAYSYKYSVNLIAGAMGTLIGGNLGKLPYLNKLGYKRMFFIATVLLLVTASIRYFLLPRDERSISNKKVKEQSAVMSLRYIFKNNKILVFSFLIFLNSMSIGGVGPFNNLVLKTVFNLNNNIISYISFSITILGMVGVLIMPAVIAKTGVGRFNLGSLILAIISCFILSLPLRSGGFISFLFLRCIAVILVCSTMESLMMSNIELEHRDIFAAMKILVNGISTAVGNYIGGYILEEVGYRGNYFYGGAIFSLATILFYIKVRKYMVIKTVNKCARCPMKEKDLHCEVKKEG